jgi:hypothetical protein
MNGNNFVALFAKTHILGSLYDQLDEVVSSLEGWNFETNDTSGGIQLLYNG